MDKMDLKSRLLSPPRRLIGAAFLMDFCVAMISLAVQNLGVHVLDAPNVVLGLFATFSSVAYTVGCLFSGSISDRTGRRRCMVASCVGCAIAWVLIPNMNSWKYVLCVVPLSGVSLSLFWPSLQAWLAELSTGGSRELSRNLGLFNILWAAGLMLGPVVTGYLWGASYTLTFYLPAALLLVLLAGILLTPRGRKDAASADPGEIVNREDNGLFLRLAWIGNFASWFAGGTIGAMFPKLGYTLDFTEPEVGWLLFAFRVGQVLMFIFTRYEQRWQYKLWPMMAAEMAAAAGMIMIVFASAKSVFAAGFMVAGVAAGITYVGSLFYSLHGRQEGRGKTSGFHEAVLGSGVFMGPLCGGLAAQYLDIRAPFAVAATVIALACAAQLLVAGADRERRENEKLTRLQEQPDEDTSDC